MRPAGLKLLVSSPNSFLFLAHHEIDSSQLSLLFCSGQSKPYWHRICILLLAMFSRFPGRRTGTRSIREWSIKMRNERRSDKRIFARWPVEITGIDEAGQQFAERTQSIDVSGLGCRFQIRNEVCAGAVIGVEPLGPNGQHLTDEFPRLFMVVRTNRNGDLLEIGVRSLLAEELSGAALDMDNAESKISWSNS
jgi:hypothetical protein